MKTRTFGRFFRNLPALAFGAMLLASLASGWGQTTNTILTTQSGGGSLPSGWTSANNVTANAIDRTTYWLVEPGSTKDFITSTNYNLAGYTSLTVNVDVATFGSGSPNLPLFVEVSTNNGSTYFTNRTSATPTSTSYVAGGPITFSNVSLSSNTVIRFSANGTSGASVRIKQLGITGVVTGSTISGAATATAFTTTYGTASTAQTFSVSGNNLTANLVATAPTGFEVSSDGTTYGNTATFAPSGGSASGTLRIRLKADAAVGGSYNAQNIVLSSTGATSVNITTAASGNSVSAKVLTITGLTAENKNWDGTTTVSVTGTPAYSGLANGETFSVTASVTWAFPDANVGTGKTLTRTGSFTAPSANYTVTQPILTANISAVLATAPAIDSIVGGNGQLSVAFSAPASSGGAAVTNYEYSMNGGGAWTARSPANTASPLIISGLINGTTYDVQLRAVNSAGSGAASGTTQGTPIAPVVPTITLSKTSLTAKTTTYGTPSASETFTVAGATLTGGDLTISAPTGFEVSTDGATYSSSVNLPIIGGNVIEATIYARLAATAAVSGSYNSQNITVSGGSATTQNVVTASGGNAVSAKALTITGLSAANKTYDGTTNVSVTGTSEYTGLANGETFSVTGSVTWAFSNASVGNAKTLARTGDYDAPSSNYTVTQPTLSADINQATAPNLTAATNATVDNPFEVTFNETSSLWRSSITSITVGGTTLSTSAYSTATGGKIVFNPALSALLQSSGAKNIVIAATGHNSATVTQSIGAGSPMQLSVATQPTAPATNGAVLATQPVVRLLDLYNNTTTNSATVTAAATQTNWVLGGTTSIAAVNGTATFSGVTATSAAAVTNVNITFTSGALSVTSGNFNIPEPELGRYSAGSTTASSVATNMTFGTLARGVGVVSATSSGYFVSSSWDAATRAGARTANEFHGFSVNSNSGFTATYRSFTFTAYRTTAGPTVVGVGYSLDGGTTWTDSPDYNLTLETTDYTFTWDFSDFTTTSTVIFRVYGWSASGSGNLRTKDFIVAGSVQAGPAITINGGTSGTSTAFTTTYGTASAAQTFTIAGSNLTANITATAPSGLEISSDGTTYGSTAVFTQSGGSASGTLRLRLAATASVGGSYNSQTITLGSSNAITRNITTAASGNTVTAKTLTITGLTGQNKDWDGTTAATVTGSPAYSGLVNGENFSVTGTVTWAFADADIGIDKSLTRTGNYNAPSTNYTVTQPILTANISAAVASAPTITGVTAGDGQLSLVFTAPGSNGGSGITNYEYSIDGGNNWSTPSPEVTSSPLLITGLSNGTTYNVQLRAVNSAGSGTASSTTQGTPVATGSPLITVSTILLPSVLTTTYGTPSSAQTFSVSGSFLNGDLTVAAPTGLEVSLSSGSGYADSLNLSPTSGVLAATDIYVRLKATAAVTRSYNSQNITITGGDAPAKNVATASSGNAVTAKELIITGVTAGSKVYDGNTTATLTTASAALSGVVSGDTVNLSSASATGTFANKTVANGKTVTTSGFSISGTDSGNYSLAQPTTTANITAKELTVTGASVTQKPFDGNTTATITGANLSGVVGGDAVTLTGGTSGIFASANVGMGISVTTSMGITGADSGNYTLTQPTLSGNISQATQTITFGALSSIVAGTTNGLTATASSGLAVTYTSSNTNVASISGTNVIANAGGVTTITASQAGNSNVEAATPVSRTLNVFGAANLGTPTSTQNFGTSAATNTSQTPSTLTITNPTSGTTYARAGASAPNAPIIVATNTPNLLGSSGAYLRAVASSSGSVTKASPIVGYTGGKEFYTSFKVRFGDSSGSTGATSGSWTFRQGAGSGYTDNNDIANNQSAVALRFTYASSGVVSLSYANVSGGFVTTGLSSSSFSQGTVYTVEVIGFNGAAGATDVYTYNGVSKTLEAGNFDLYINGVQIATNLTSGNLFLDATIDATAFIGINSAGNAANLFVDDFVVYNTIPAAIGTGPGITPSGTFPPLVTTYGTASSNNSVLVSGGGLTSNITATAPTGFEVSTNGSAWSSNATFTQIGSFANGTLFLRLATNAAAGSYNNQSVALVAGSISNSISVSNSTVSKKSITGSFAASNKTYDGTIAAAVAMRAVSGKVGSDDVNHTGGTATFADANAGTGKTVTLTGAILAGSAASNYTLSSVSTTTADIEARSLAITADAKGKTYGDTDPALTYASTGLVGADVISGNLTRASGENVGIYAIDQGTLTAGANYSISFTGANFTINTASLPVVSFTAPASLTYDATAKTYLASATGPSSLVLTYTGRGSTTYSNTAAPINVGDYTVTATSGDSNYTGSQAEDFSIAPLAVIGSFTASNKTYDATTAAAVTGRSLTGVVESDDASLDGGTANFDDANAGTGKTVTLTGATLSGAAAGNYTLGSVSTTTANIDKAAPSITAAPTASNIDAGQALSSSTLSGGSASVPGDFAWTFPGTVVSATGNYSVTFTPTDAANYNTASALVNVTVNLNGYNAWAGTNGLTGSNALGLADPDGDGFINNAEYAFGTRPTVADGSLVTNVATNGVFRTSWNGPASGVTYGVQVSTNLSTMAFSNDPTVTIESSGGVMSFTNQATGNKFFRVRATSN